MHTNCSALLVQIQRRCIGWHMDGLWYLTACIALQNKIPSEILIIFNYKLCTNKNTNTLLINFHARYCTSILPLLLLLLLCVCFSSLRPLHSPQSSRRHRSVNYAWPSSHFKGSWALINTIAVISVLGKHGSVKTHLECLREINQSWRSALMRK